MGRQLRAMHVARIRGSHVDQGGRRREYESRYLRRSYREDGKVKHETLANLSGLADEVVDAIEAALKGTRLVAAETAVTIARSLPHGHVAAVSALAGKLGLPRLLGPACRERDLALALIVSRVVHPTSKLATLTWWSDTTLGVDLDVAGASTDEVYAAMDWLVDRQDGIERGLADRHLSGEANPSRMALFDLTSAWMEGRCCPLAARGYSRDAKKGKLQIEYGLLTDPAGRPVAVRVFDGATGDPTAFTEIVSVVRDTFGLHELVLVGDRGMITKARVEALRELNDDPDTGDAFGWITALRAPSIARLVRDGAVQLSLFDQQDLAEISHPDYPGERLIACRNPLLAAERARKRDELLAATDKLLDQIAARVRRGTLAGADDIGVAVGKQINTYKVGKHFQVTITDTSLAIERKHDQIAAEAALDGIYVLRTSLPADTLDTTGVVLGYKNLAHVERDFRIVKADDLDLRPIHHRLEDRVKAHVLICMLACYLVWHLRKAWAPLTFTDQHPPERDNPVAPARRSADAEHKASRQRDQHGLPYHSFGGLLDHLATLTRNQVCFPDTNTELPILAEATPDQRLAFELIGVAIPKTLK
ncbi:MAG: IS1634 family transposase [Thermocrispum sp.]